MQFILAGALASYLAYLLGSWRQGCLHRATHEGYGVPRAWQQRSVRIASWVGVSFFAMLAAGCLLAALGPRIGLWPGLVGGAVLLYLRWALSCYSAMRRIALLGVPLRGALPALQATRRTEGRLEDLPVPPFGLASHVVAIGDDGLIARAPANKSY